MELPWKEKKQLQKVEKCTKQDSNQGPLSHQSCIWPLDCCTGSGITVEIKSNKSIVIQGKLTHFLKKKKLWLFKL